LPYLAGRFFAGQQTLLITPLTPFKSDSKKFELRLVRGTVIRGA
jgi:hypothetical protein